MAKKHYLNNKNFNQEIKEYFLTKDKKIYNEIGKKFLLIATNFMNKHRYINRSDDRKDEMISDAAFCMVKYLHNYNTDLGNPLAYFTQIAKNAFLQNIEKYNLKKERFISLSITENLDYSNSTSMIVE